VFDIAWGEFIVIAVVALIVIGPKELPAVLRAIGQWTTKIRRMAAEFQGQFQEALREAEMADLKKEVDNLSDTAKGFTSQFDDPLNFKEATKWEPKPDAAKPDTAKPDEAAKPADTQAQSALVTPDGYAAPEPVSDTPASETVAVAAEHPVIEPPTLPSPAGGGGKGGGTADAAPASPAAQSVVAQPPPTEGSGQRSSEEGVRT
jgi:sec-independent protein translocase protein TatB